MPILSDRGIMDLVSQGLLIQNGFRESNLTPNGYDLTADSFRVGGSQDSVPHAIAGPGEVFWASTREVLNMPDNIGGQLWIRSSYARKGILGSFGFVDAGFRGNLTLAFFNASSESVEVEAGKTIVQIVFMLLEGRADSLYAERSGNYQGQRGITGSRNL